MKINKCKILIIGYGNSLRNDDGVGQKVAQEIEQLFYPYVKSIYQHQLTPELVEFISNCSIVIFVDACIDHNMVNLINLTDKERKENYNGHYSSPEYLLYLTNLIYHQSPQSYLISIPIENIDLGENISSLAQNGMKRAIEIIINIIQQN